VLAPVVQGDADTWKKTRDVEYLRPQPQDWVG